MPLKCTSEKVKIQKVFQNNMHLRIVGLHGAWAGMSITWYADDPFPQASLAAHLAVW